MKLVLAVVCVAVVAVEFGLCAIPNKILASPHAELWKAWKHKYNKEYETIAEETTRFDIWAKAVKEVSEHNVGYDLGMHTYRRAVNEFADMTIQEFSAQRFGFRGAQKANVGGKALDTEASSVPSSVNWVDAGYVTGVKNQGQCGSCWAFSTTGAVEGVHFNATGDLVSLSEEELVDCDNRDYGCNGGWPYNGITFFSKHGAVSEADYPYTAYYGYGSPCQLSGKSIAATVTGYVSLPSGDEAALKVASAQVGPISIAIDANHASFQQYSSGVYYEPYCSSTSLDHAVLLVGYGTENGEDYWLVKNSWGTTWGDNGYIKMIRNYNNNCGVATEAVYAYL